MHEVTHFNEDKLTPEKRREVAGLSPRLRQALIKSVLVRYPRFKEMSAFVSKFHRPVVDGTHATGQLGALLGESRSGKSFVLKAYKQDFPARDGKSARIRPVIYAEIRDDMTAFDVINTIAKQVGYLSTPKVKVATYIDMNRSGFPGGRLVWVRRPRLAPRREQSSALRPRREACFRSIRADGEC